jgi:hypothetical protein
MRECYAVGCLFFAIIHFGGLLIRPQGWEDPFFTL